MEKKSEIKNQNIEKKLIEKELEESYLDYAMSVIVSRALPDARDGLKPVQRRILYSMHEDGLRSSARFKKSATVVGGTMARFHPHGDSSIYEALVRMAQDFSMGAPLVEGQGNFGSLDDPPGAQRYTEARLSKIGEEMLKDIEKRTVDFIPNYDGTKKEPVVLPSPFPNLLVNGSLGIAVGTATNIPTHNLGEVIETAKYLIDNPKAETEKIISLMPGPDFPTGGEIVKTEMKKIYEQGSGKITIRGKADIQDKPSKIIITELPFQVSKSSLIEKIIHLIQEEKIKGIKNIRDESDREGLRISIELKEGIAPQRILNLLYHYTDLSKDFYYNLVALEGGIQPKVFSIKELFFSWINHRKEVIKRRTEFDLTQAKERAHILEGLSLALKHIDEVIKTIKQSKNREQARDNLIKKFKFSIQQAEAILEMKLSSLAHLEREKIENELKEKRELIKKLSFILANPKEILKIIKEELNDIKKRFSFPRKTNIKITSEKEFKEEDAILEEETIIALTSSQYIKRVSPLQFRIQKRGGKGISGIALKNEDSVSQFLSASTKDNLLFFTNKGKIFKIKAYEIPQTNRTSRGKLIHNFLNLEPKEKIKEILPLSKSQNPRFLTLITRKGLVKKTDISQFENIRKTGIRAIKLSPDDELVAGLFSSGEDEIILASAKGYCLRFKEKDLRAIGRQASGVVGLRLGKNDYLTDGAVIKKEEKNGKLLVITQRGYAKQTPIKQYRLQKRGGKGISASKITPKTGLLVSLKMLPKDKSEIFLITENGQVLRTKIDSVKIYNRVSQGLRLINLGEEDIIKEISFL